MKEMVQQACQKQIPSRMIATTVPCN